MIPAAGDEVRLGGLALREHWFEVPLDHAHPDGETITLFAREAVSAEKAATGADADLPWLLFLQGGPGGKAPRPDGSGGWVGRAVRDFRVLLLDQRGTGRSTPATARTLAMRGGPDAQADYLGHLRADSIVADAELIRRRVVGADGQWSVLGQSYGGFCALTYLSVAPEALTAVYLTGGLAPLSAAVDDVYAATYRTVEAKNAAFRRAFPGVHDRIAAVAGHLRSHAVALPDGSPLTVPRLQSLGLGLGARSAYPSLAYLFEEAFADGRSGGGLSDTFLAGVWSRTSFSANPLYAVMHESIYGQSTPTRWAAERVRDDFPQFAPDADPVLLTGEMIYPWMFDVDPALRPLRETAEILADRTWTPLYDPEVLARNAVPVAAVLYTDDMFVDATLARRTAASVANTRVWETNAYEHDGLRESGDVLDRLIRIARGEI